MEYKIISKESFQVAGIRKVTEAAGGVWAIVKADGSMKKMQEIAGEDKVTLGLCFGFDEKGHNDNMAGFLTDEEQLDGYEVYQYPASRWAELTAGGRISDHVMQDAWQYIHEELLAKGILVQKDVPTIEEYVLWDEEKDSCKVNIYIAVQ